MNICTRRNLFCIACTLILVFISLSLFPAQAKTVRLPETIRVVNSNGQHNYSATADTSLHPGADTSGKIVPEKDSSIKKKTGTAYTWVQQMPRYPGTTTDEGSSRRIRHFLHHAINYPADARALGLEGTIYVGFIVETDGSLTHFKIMNVVKPPESLAKEALRVAEAMPKWIPGRQNGRPVTVIFNIPIKFKL